MAKNKKNKNRRAQTPKVGNEAYMRGMQELRRSNASGLHRSKKSYTRKTKHRNDWE